MDLEGIVKRIAARHPPTEPDCPECRDTGWIVTPDGGAGTAARCRCRTIPTDAGLDARLLEIGMYQDEVDGSKEPWQATIGKKKVDGFPLEAMGWLNGALETSPARPVLLLHGPPGRGKSKLAAMLCRKFVAARFLSRALWVYWSAALRLDRINPAEANEDRMNASRFLVIDDASKRLDEYGLDTLERIFNYRQGNRLPTIITMNLEPDNATLSATLSSRFQRAVPIAFSGPVDIRAAK